MFEKEVVCSKIPDYPKCFAYVDKGIPLYYFSCYKPIKLTTRLQVINALSYGVELYTGVREEDYV